MPTDITPGGISFKKLKGKNMSLTLMDLSTMTQVMASAMA
jgi:hypothetical protein